MDNIRLAIRYYQALYDKQFETVRALASENFKFLDPTVTDETNLPIKKDNLSDFLRYMEQSISDDMTFEIETTDVFESNNIVILSVKSKITAPANIFGGAEGTIHVSTKGITVLTIKNSKIISHIDYFDYPALQKMIQSQIDKQVRDN